MKQLNGLELAGFIKERQAHSVRSLTQSRGITPKLSIIRTADDPVTASYLKLKQRYGEDIGVQVQVVDVALADAVSVIKKLNEDSAVHGIIVQLPLPDKSRTDEILNAVAAEKDVDGLAQSTLFDVSTPTAVNWLLAGYNIELAGKRIVIIGQGRLVGEPLAKMWQKSGYTVEVIDENTEDVSGIVEADVLVSAAGVPGLVASSSIKAGAVVVDAGVASDKGVLRGDVEEAARERSDISITPIKGGVGPLTLAALFENVITACRRQSEK